MTDAGTQAGHEREARHKRQAGRERVTGHDWRARQRTRNQGTGPGGSHETGTVFDIQRYSLGDGPGIRTTVFLKGCPLRCAWCQNPESLRRAPEIAYRADRCIDCLACVDVCPRQAIRPAGPVRLDRSRCDGCGACAEACPTGATTVVGSRYTVAELVETVDRDRAFHTASGGGVTVSGGEPTGQYAFVRAFLEACRNTGINTAIETNGLVDRDRLASLVPLLDTILFDLKLADSAEHARYTGSGNRQILENARWLAGIDAPVTFRIPLVPTATATTTNLRGLGGFLTSIGVDEVELCPYHTGWEHKLHRFDSDQRPPGFPAATAADIRYAVATLSATGMRRIRTT